MNRPVVLTLHALLLATAAVLAADAPNLVSNGDFSALSKNLPADWSISGDTRSVDQALSVQKDSDGRPFAKLTCTRVNRDGPSSHAMLCQIGKVQLTRGRAYEFSCRMRQENLAGRSVSVAITDTKVWKNCGLSAQFAVGPDWKTYRRIFTATEDVGPSSRLQIWYTEPGTLSIADVRLVAIKLQDVEFTNIIPPTGSKNLIPNSSFELDGAGWSSMGTGVGWGDLSKLHGTFEHDGTIHGRSFLRIPMGDGRTPTVAFDYYEPILRQETRPLVASVGWIKLEPGSTYTLSCWMRASVDGTPALLAVQTRDPQGGSRMQQKELTLSTAWKRYAFSFKPQQRYGFVLAGPNLAKDQRVDVDLDAIQLEKSDSASDFAPRFELEWAIEPAQPAGIFTNDQPRQLILRSCNFSDKRQQILIKFDVTDFDDQAVPLPEVQLSLAPKSNSEKRIDLPTDWRGYYHVIATAKILDRTETSRLRIAIVPRQTQRDSVCGINHAFTTTDAIHLASKAGVTWYRDWSLKLQHIEPQKGQFRWDLSDAQIDRVLKEGTSVLPLLPPFPSADWCSEAPAGINTKGYPGSRIKSAFAPKDPADLTTFIELAVARYKDRIHLWEFLNEPVYTDYALPADSMNRYGGKKYTAADYVAWLEKAAAAMRKADPSCKVMGGIAGGPRTMTKGVIDAGILKHIDLFNLHIYPGYRTPEAYLPEMDQLLAMMDAAGGRKPIWMTEFSYYGADDLPRKPFFPRPNSWSEERLLDSERQCSDYTLRFFLVMLSRNVEKIFIHSGAGGRVNDPNFECAFFAEGCAPRKLFPALAVFNKLMGPAPKFAGEAMISNSGRCAAFETGDSALLVFWHDREGAGQPIPLAAPKDAKWIDPMGRTLSTAPRWSSSPQYLIAPPGQAKAIMGMLPK